MATQSTILQRCGRLLYWIGVGLGLLGAGGIVAAALSVGAGLQGLGLAAALFLVPFSIGRIARYVLAGE